jgi:hypothetical protein
MGIDIFKNKENEALRKNINVIASELNNMQKALGKDYKEILNIQIKIDELNKKNIDLGNECNNKENILKELNNKIDILNKEIIFLEDEKLYQSFSLYIPIYDFANSEQYKNKLDVLRQNQKNMIKNDSAVNYSNNWTVDGSLAKGKKMTKDNVKQILRSFNTECENVIDRVKFNNVDTMRNRILKAFEQLNKLNEVNKVSITTEYLNSKLNELSLAYEYQVKKQEEKEEQKRIREELKEQAKVAKELEEAKKNILKDKQHYENAISEIEKRLKNTNNEIDQQNLISKKHLLEIELDNINVKLNDIDYRQNNQKAGYVYIISNIGSFGENIYKIGMTRRLEPEERIQELSDASVPFNFDIHAMIFTEDAPKLENALHKAFELKKINMINNRREFFNVTLDEIKNIVKSNFDNSVEFVEIAPAEQYRESSKIKENIK